MRWWGSSGQWDGCTVQGIGSGRFDLQSGVVREAGHVNHLRSHRRFTRRLQIRKGGSGRFRNGIGCCTWIFEWKFEWVFEHAANRDTTRDKDATAPFGVGRPRSWRGSDVVFLPGCCHGGTCCGGARTKQDVSIVRTNRSRRAWSKVSSWWYGRTNETRLPCLWSAFVLRRVVDCRLLHCRAGEKTEKVKSKSMISWKGKGIKGSTTSKIDENVER